MKTKLLTICFLLVTSQVFADPDYKWKKMTEAKTYFWYWDSKNLTKNKDNYLMWVLYAHKYIEKGVGSQIALIEIDCAYNRYKNIYLETFEGRMGKGKLIKKLSNTESPGHDVWKWKFMRKGKNIHSTFFLAFCNNKYFNRNP